MAGKAELAKAEAGKKPEKRRKKQLHPYQRELTENQLKAARLWVFGDENGNPIKSQAQLAVMCDVSSTSIYRYFALERFRDEIERLLKDQKRDNEQAIMRYVPKAIDALSKALDAPQARDRIHAAKAILEMAGYGDKTININLNDTTGVVRGGFGRAEIESARDVVEASEIIDADYVVVCEEGRSDDGI